MTSASSKVKNDCVIVAIANATGKSYDEIAANLPSPGKHGIMHDKWSDYLKTLGWYKSPSVPRRGQDKITGIVRFYSSKRATGHLVWMKDGIVFDSNFPAGLPIKEYQLRTTKKHIHMIWRKDIALIDTPTQTTDTEVSLDFLRSLLP